MADNKSKFDVSKSVNNSLISGAGVSFPFENFTNSAFLVPAAEKEADFLSVDAGEADSFLGQRLTSPLLPQLAQYQQPTAPPLSNPTFQQHQPWATVPFSPASQFQPISTTSAPSLTSPSIPAPTPCDSPQFYAPQPSGPAASAPHPPPVPYGGADQPPGGKPGLITQLTPLLPSSGGTPANSYRLGGLKRLTYAPPPDLAVCPPSVSAHFAVSGGPKDMAATSSASPRPVLFVPAVSASPNVAVTQQLPKDTADARREDPFEASATLHTTPIEHSGSYHSPVVSQTTPSAVLSPAFSAGQGYRPVYHHWFYRKDVEGKHLWHPFSMTDSLKLEETFTSPNLSAESKVACEGGRYDVEVLRRRRTAVFWQEEPGEVRRCSWFVKGTIDTRYVPYEENTAARLEEEYRLASVNDEWNRRIELTDGETIILHSVHAMSQHLRSSSPDTWGNSAVQKPAKPRLVKRGHDDFDISEGEPETVDHLLFLVHGIGKVCDLKFRDVVEVVDEFRSMSLQLLQAHFREGCEQGSVGRVEVLPISWHQALHSEDIDTRLRNITLASIPRLRQFTNDTLLDILFYTSPVFCEKIVQAVGNEMNRLYALYCSRNPHFKGGVSVGGHSLGSLIVFDMLCNQRPHPSPSPQLNCDHDLEGDEELAYGKARLHRGMSYVTINTAGTGQPYIAYPQLAFSPRAFFALGSPVGMFVTVRGLDSLGANFKFPTCPAFFNIFHPFDPIAFRVETLVSPEMVSHKPVLIPHHKGRKRMHLELKDTMAHVGNALKAKLMDSVRYTWNSVCQIAMFRSEEHDKTIEEEVDMVLHSQMMGRDAAASMASQGEAEDPTVLVGALNGGRRIDYVLQEAPLESFNEYIFALSSHVCYWESQDTMLMILKEVYADMNIAPDCQVPQPTLPFDVTDTADSNTPSPYQLLPLTNDLGLSTPTLGVDPTAPSTADNGLPLGPPPVSGFVRK